MPELTPVWLGDLLAAAMIATSAYCAARIGYAWVVRRATHRDVDALHLLMGIAMAGMLARCLKALTPVGGVLHAVWIVVFAVGAAWFAVRATARRRALPNCAAAGHGGGPVVHLIGAAAMLYMLAATPAGGMAAMGGAAGSGATLPEVGVTFAVLATAAAVLILDRLTLLAPGARPAAAGVGVVGGATIAAGSGASIPGTTATGPVIAPRTAECCHLLMCVVTAYMLIAMFA